jgi:hypothetical protein
MAKTQPENHKRPIIEPSTMNKTILHRIASIKWLQYPALVLGATLCVAGLTGRAQTETSPGAAEQRFQVTTNEAREAIQEKGQAALNKIQVLWQRIDERRLKNRTPDELIAWAVMGLLVGGLLFRFGKRGQVTSIFLGLFGAFIGGIVAHVAQLDFGLGPVLITYEDLICTLLGGALMLCGARWSTLMKFLKPPGT